MLITLFSLIFIVLEKRTIFLYSVYTLALS